MPLLSATTRRIFTFH